MTKTTDNLINRTRNEKENEMNDDIRHESILPILSIVYGHETVIETALARIETRLPCRN
jgi:hypothetical protein